MSGDDEQEDVASLAKWVATQSFLFNDEGSPFRAACAPGWENVVVVTGENASGKSLFVRVLAAYYTGLAISVSIRERTESGIRKAFMFGDEHDQSTGANSVKVTSTAFKNLDRDRGSLLILDEPEMGLSDGYARALGEYIGQQVEGIPDCCVGVVVVTHSRSLTQGLYDGYKRLPTHVAVAAESEPDAGLLAWLDSTEHKTVDDLLSLKDTAFERWRMANKLLKS